MLTNNRIRNIHREFNIDYKSFLYSVCKKLCMFYSPRKQI